MYTCDKFILTSTGLMARMLKLMIVFLFAYAYLLYIFVIYIYNTFCDRFLWALIIAGWRKILLDLPAHKLYWVDLQTGGPSDVCQLGQARDEVPSNNVVLQDESYKVPSARDMPLAPTVP